MSNRSVIVFPVVLCATLLLAGCAGDGRTDASGQRMEVSSTAQATEAGAKTPSAPAGGSAAMAEHAVVHSATAADTARLSEKTPVTSDRVRLYVNGMGCPLCVSNVDKQLERLRGVKSTQVNLADGTVDVELYSKARPTPAQFAKAVNGDFTLVKIEELK